MKCFDIDLYDYFNLKKPEGAGGKLNVCLHGVTNEINAERKSPAMLVIPGGGYAMCSGREGEPIAVKYFADGFNTFTLTYSVAPLKYPTALYEAAMAMIYIRKHADELNVDAGKVAAVGFSAGGHLCGCLGILAAESVLDVFGDDKKLIRPNAILLIYPVISSYRKPHSGSFDNLCGDDKQLRKYLSLEDRVDKNSSPAFTTSTYGDDCVPVKNSLLIADAYEEAGVPFALNIFEKGGHGMSLNSTLSDSAKNVAARCASEDYALWQPMSVKWLKERGICVDN